MFGAVRHVLRSILRELAADILLDRFQHSPLSVALRMPSHREQDSSVDPCILLVSALFKLWLKVVFVQKAVAAKHPCAEKIFDDAAGHILHTAVIHVLHKVRAQKDAEVGAAGSQLIQTFQRCRRKDSAFFVPARVFPLHRLAHQADQAFLVQIGDLHQLHAGKVIGIFPKEFRHIILSGNDRKNAVILQ